MKVGIVVNGYYTAEAYARQVGRLGEELALRGAEAVVYRNDRGTSLFEEYPFDRAFFLDKDIVLARMMEKKGVRLVNSADAIEKADDKGRTYVELSGAVEQQETVVRPKRYFYKRDEIFLNKTAERLGFPLVAKESCGSLGEQVFLINDVEELYKADEKFALKNALYQKFRAESKGRSLRVLCVGGKAIGGIELENLNDFRSNAAEGGSGRKATLKKEFVEAAEKAAEVLGAEYCGVDLFCDSPVVIEVNTNAFFEEFERVTGINVAAECVEYILNIKGRRVDG